MKTITIYADNVWAGNGRLVGGSIVDCAAILGGTQDAADSIYEAIEETIADGDDQLTVDDVCYTWVIESHVPATMREARRDGYVTVGEFGLPPTAGYIVAERDCADAVRRAYDAIEEGDLGPNVLDAVRAAGGLYIIED
jgi:hypothetical protein